MLSLISQLDFMNRDVFAERWLRLAVLLDEQREAGVRYLFESRLRDLAVTAGCQFSDGGDFDAALSACHQVLHLLSIQFHNRPLHHNSLHSGANAFF